MKQIKKNIFGWILTLLASMMVITSLVGCSAEDAELALDVAVGVLEAVEEIEALESEAQMETTFEDQTDISSQAQPETRPEPSTEAESESEETQPESSMETEEIGLTVEEGGSYTSKDEVALYLHTYGELPPNFISKKEAENLGWKKKDGEAGQLHVVAPGMSIGGSSFGNYEGLLPEKKGRKYYECDINYVKGNRGAERIVYSNDGLIFYTGDHYESFEQLYPVE